MLNKQKLREPVVLAFITAAVPILAAFILQVLEGTDILDNALWLRTLLTGIGVLVGTLTSAWARSQVLSPATAAKHGLPDPANLPNTPNSPVLGTFETGGIGGGSGYPAQPPIAADSGTTFGGPSRVTDSELDDPPKP
jgi:hypothetical protein